MEISWMGVRSGFWDERIRGERRLDMMSLRLKQHDDEQVRLEVESAHDNERKGRLTGGLMLPD